MRVLQTSQKHFGALGFTREQAMQKYRMNGKLSMGLLSIVYALIACTLYLVFVDKTKTFDKCIACVCTIMAIFVTATCFVTMIFGMSILMKCIDDIENLIETSECFKHMIRKIKFTFK